MLSRFHNLLEDYFAPSRGRVNTSGGYCSPAAASNFQQSVVDLSKRKSELSSQEKCAKRAALSAETKTEASYYDILPIET